MASVSRSTKPVRVPRRVARVAAHKQLGTLTVGQRSDNPVVFMLAFVGIGLLLCGLPGLFIAGAGQFGLAELAFGLSLPLIGLAGVAGIIAVLALVNGFWAAYLFTDGIVTVRNGRLRAAAWSEVDELWRWIKSRELARISKKDFFDYYVVVTTDGQRLPVLPMTKGDPTVGDQLLATVTRLGRPVKDNGPAAGERGI
jgi:hypothetical protein